MKYNLVPFDKEHESDKRLFRRESQKDRWKDDELLLANVSLIEGSMDKSENALYTISFEEMIMNKSLAGILH